LAFAALAFSLATLVPIGLVIRRQNYVDATTGDVANGGLHFNGSANGGLMVLMGDSNAAMYGKMVAELADEQNLKLTMIGVAAGDPLPHSSGETSPLWLESLEVVKHEKPDLLVIACNWSKLSPDTRRLDSALKHLSPFSGRIIVLTQPPQLPAGATRQSIRAGSRPPFFEDPEERWRRFQVNAIVRSVSQDRVSIVDIEPLFSTSNGEVVFLDMYGRELYQDRDHLSDIGAQLVKKELLRAIKESQRKHSQ
jgi:hypothetical protein